MTQAEYNQLLSDKEVIDRYEKQYSIKSMWCVSRMLQARIEHYKSLNGLKSILNCIYSLPEEPANEDVDNAARDYADTCRLDNNVDFIKRQLCVEHFKAGANWQKEQMLKNAIEGWVQENFYKEWLDWFSVKVGDKVKLMVVKEDEHQT